MFHRITCPTCQHKFTVPEAAMGQRQTCPNCQALFLAGKSTAETPGADPMKQQQVAAGAAPMNKTMLGETDPPAPPIKYNCPRCKAALESPVAEALTKKPCPKCGGRLQVPAAPKTPAPVNPLNKTILASDESGAAAPPIPSATVLSTPSSHAEKSTPAPAKAGFGPLAIAGVGAGGLVVLALLACVIAMLFTGGDREKIKAQQEAFEKAQRDLVELQNSIKQKEELIALKRSMEAEQQKKWDLFMDEHRRKVADQERARQREIDMLADDAQKAKLRERARQEKEDADRREREEAAKKAQVESDLKRELDKLRNDLNTQNQKAQETRVIVSQPPPVYYPPWHYRYYYGW